MGDDQATHRDPTEADLEREIRERRKFSLADAIGRLAGPGVMKGAPPTTRKQQAEAELESFLEHLSGPAGALSAVLFRQVTVSELLLNNLDQPLVVLASSIKRILDSEFLLRELVRECDVEWGRVYGERPYFDKEGCPPNQDDPYTVESVRRMLCQVFNELAAKDSASANVRDRSGK